MADISEVAEGVYLIETEGSKDLGAMGLPQCSMIYFVVDGGTALIDTGPAVVVPAVIDAICQVGYDPGQLSYIIPTHIHLDHAGGVGILAKQFPQLVQKTLTIDSTTGVVRGVYKYCFSLSPNSSFESIKLRYKLLI